MRNLLIKSISELKEISKKYFEETKIAKLALDTAKSDKGFAEQISASVRKENEALNKINKELKRENALIIKNNAIEQRNHTKTILELLVRLDNIKNDTKGAEKILTRYTLTQEDVKLILIKREELEKEVAKLEIEYDELVQSYKAEEIRLDSIRETIADKSLKQKDTEKEQSEINDRLNRRQTSLNQYSKSLEKSVKQHRKWQQKTLMQVQYREYE